MNQDRNWQHIHRNLGLELPGNKFIFTENKEDIFEEWKKQKWNKEGRKRKAEKEDSQAGKAWYQSNRKPKT